VRFLAELLLREEKGAAGGRWFLVHGSPSNQLYGYLHPWLDPDALCTRLGRRARLTPLRGSGACGTPFDGYVVGHTRLQFMRVYEGNQYSIREA